MSDANQEVLKSIITAQSMTIIDLADAVRRLSFEVSDQTISVDMNRILNRLDGHIHQTVTLTNSLWHAKKDD